MNCKFFKQCGNVAIPNQSTCTVCQVEKKYKLDKRIEKYQRLTRQNSVSLSASDRKYIKNSNAKLANIKPKI